MSERLKGWRRVDCGEFSVETPGDSSIVFIGKREGHPFIAAWVNSAFGQDHVLDKVEGLILAAPDLLEALVSLMDAMHPDAGEAHRKLSIIDARAAIAKATGGAK